MRPVIIGLEKIEGDNFEGNCFKNHLRPLMKCNYVTVISITNVNSEEID